MHGTLMPEKQKLKYNYCTLFDSFYLSRGLALYESLLDHSSAFTLYIFPFDEIAEKILLSLNLKNVIIVPLHDFETSELLEVKKERSKAEYCWTCTPSVISYVLNNLKAANCTYIDADLFFYSNPDVLISELSETGKSVLITEHRYSLLPRIYEEKRSGRFCVQFMTFLNKKDSLAILETWRLQCIEWCFARHEDGKFGDQKYLDVWPQKYENVHILVNEGGGVAPWNIQKYRFGKGGKSICGFFRSNGKQFDVVFYHFQYVKFLRNATFDIGWYNINSSIKELFYKPYTRLLLLIEERIKESENNYTKGYTDFPRSGLKNRIKTFFKEKCAYNIIK